MTPAKEIQSTTRRLSPQLIELLRSLEAGQRIKITQTVRVGSRKWTSETKGVFRGLNYLATGITTDRVPEDDVIVPVRVKRSIFLRIDDVRAIISGRITDRVLAGR